MSLRMRELSSFDLAGDLLRLDEQDRTLQCDKQVRVEDQVEQDIVAGQTEHAAYRRLEHEQHTRLV